MANFNKVLLLGNLTRDPALKYLPSQTPVAEFGLACNRKWKTQQGEDREEVLFVDCAAFGRQAEVINQYCTKGRPIFIEGRLKLDTWEDKQGGGKRSKLSVVIESFQLLGSAGGGGGRQGEDAANEGGGAESRPARPAGNRGPQRPPQGRGPAPAGAGPQGDAPQENFAEDDIPF